MRTAILALTANASRLARSLGDKLGADIFLKPEFLPPEASPPASSAASPKALSSIRPISGSFADCLRGVFRDYNEIICIMACGIVVRALAPLVESKLEDPAVVVVDEKGRHAVSLLSGHWGGANRLAERIAALLGGEAVITTATDVNGMIAFDEWARRNDCAAENPGELKFVSAALVNGSRVRLRSSHPLRGAIPENIVPTSSLTVESGERLVVLSNSTELPGLPEHSLVLRPRDLVLGIGCKRGTTADAIETAALRFLGLHGKSPLSLRCVATIDLKGGEPGIVDFCRRRKLPLETISAERIAAVEEGFTGSKFVKQSIGVACVAEPAAVLAGRRAALIGKKTAYGGLTLALAEEEKEISLVPDQEPSRQSGMGRIAVVGIGPGNAEDLTPRARSELESADVIVGYRSYIDLLEPLFPHKRFERSGMTQEVERCREVYRLAREGMRVALVSSGDSGVYGMAGIMLQVAESEGPPHGAPGGAPPGGEIPVEIVPGLTSALSAAARLGAPLMHDFSVISLSDLLTSWDLIAKRLDLAASGDFVICLYNPKSAKRDDYIGRAQAILLAHRGPDTPVGILRDAGRDDEICEITTLGLLEESRIDMHSIVIVGNSRTYVRNGRMITPRGYAL